MSTDPSQRGSGQDSTNGFSDESSGVSRRNFIKGGSFAAGILPLTRPG